MKYLRIEVTFKTGSKVTFQKVSFFNFYQGLIEILDRNEEYKYPVSDIKSIEIMAVFGDGVQ